MNNRLSRELASLLVAVIVLCSIGVKGADSSAVEWTDIRTLDVEGRGWNDTAAFYDRLPARANGMVPPAVYYLSRQSAGMLVRFTTDARTIKARWSLTSTNLALPHMPATGVSGLDLYVRGSDRKWHWAGNGIPKAQTNEVNLIADMDPGEREYLLYLPLYNGVHSVELGVANGCKLTRAGPWGGGERKPIVFYGTSIQQGGCATRPGMVHSSILGRWLDWPTINLGFSGAGKMEIALAELISELDASVYVLDCLPNMDHKLLDEHLEPFIRLLRKARPNTPIVLVEDRTFSNAHLVPGRREGHALRRKVLSDTYNALKEDGVKELYYIPGEGLLGPDHEGTVDASHPTDLGYMHQARAMEKTLRPLLKP
jgi:hypothetical protein